uniref:ABC transporter permease n=1 Tax=Enterocloster clostridioformis TaxID=1531 RepID=UPI001C3E5BC4|nr:FtsX-like permease family protein [Enterocloster clostridioformis]
MRSYLSLVSRYEKVHRKNNRISILCIVLSVLLVTAIFSMADMAIRAQKNYFIKTNGEYHIGLTGIDEQTAELISARIDVASCGWIYQGCTGEIGQKAVSFAGADVTAFTELSEMNLQEGDYPIETDEALLNESALKQLGLTIGDTVTVTIPDGSQRVYHITGILEDMGSMLKADVYGMVLSEDGFREIADENAVDGTRFRIQFKDGVDIQKAIQQIKESYGLDDGQISENTVLLGLMGQSENSTMQSLYLVAVFLVLLVLIAGTVMIAASFNTNVLERVQFYGMLRCLGASKKQVKRFVILQGLRQSVKGVPIGLVIGQVITWGACLLLKTVSGERFSEIPMFQFSCIGLVAGVIVGFLIVLLASLSPAKKAAKVSPVTAISGNTQLTQNKKAANTKLFHVETSMGIFHALSGKKNVFLMTCSFAISIMMFLSFQVMVVFLNQGMPALSPSAADVSATMGSTSFQRSLVQEIGKIDGVDRAFGRMEATGLTVLQQDEIGTVTLVSYDENQIQWAKDELNEGTVDSVQKDTNHVLVSYRDGMDWKIGDTLTLQTSAGDTQVIIAGILATTNANNAAGSEGYIICSEQTFMELVGELGYTTIDVQFSKEGNDDTVSVIRSLLPSDSAVSDKRLTNSEAQSSYYTGAIFIYGFLAIIALITVFNIFNSMNASVTSRTKQYGIMRSIGMGTRQLYKMIAAEAFTYSVLGCVVGCVLGLPLNKMMFQFLIADKWGTGWSVPVASLVLIVLLCLASAAIAIRLPIKQISKKAIVDIIKSQQ